jgi:hypothetical protein
MNTLRDADARAFHNARRAGIDLDLIDTNLALSVKERWRQHDGALRVILELERGKKARDAGLQPTDH